MIRNKTAALGLEFPMELLTLEGESLSLPDESFDQVRRWGGTLYTPPPSSSSRVG